MENMNKVLMAGIVLLIAALHFSITVDAQTTNKSTPQAETKLSTRRGEIVVRKTTLTAKQLSNIKRRGLIYKVTTTVSHIEDETIPYPQWGSIVYVTPKFLNLYFDEQDRILDSIAREYLKQFAVQHPGASPVTAINFELRHARGEHAGVAIRRYHFVVEPAQ